MKVGNLRSGMHWPTFVGMLGAIVAAGCATTPVPEPAELSAWADFDDCFQRSVSVPPGGAERMARTCSGESAAGDPSRSGIDRANAYFNAASAFNALAASDRPNSLCRGSGACSQVALNLLDQSIANQRDGQIRPTDNADENAANEQFVLRRKTETGRALRALAASGLPDASCGTRTACLAKASRITGSAEVEASLKSEDERLVRLACDLLDIRWRINSDLGLAQEHLYVDDLRKIVEACPSHAATAADRLAEISFDRAERVREALVQAGTTVSAEAAQGAITDYRDASKVERFKLPAYRGMGAVYRSLARLEPGAAPTYLANAGDAFSQAVTLAANSEPAENRADDLEQFGTTLIELAQITSRPGSPERRALYERAAMALQDAVHLQPTPRRYLALGEATAEIGQYQQSIAAYRSAIAELSGNDQARASLALAGVLDLTGNPDGALQALEQAVPTPEVQFEIGRRRFYQGMMREALAALQPVAGRLNALDDAAAHYMVSVAESVLRTSGWQQRALDHAERAVGLNARMPEYVRQACLANILSGGKAVRDATSLNRCPDNGTPESRLLRGMYFLKQAQSLDVSAYDLGSQTRWRGVLRSAEEAFQGGQNALRNAPEGERKARFDDLQADVDLSERLQQGLTVVRRCRREITIETNDPIWKELDAFFGYYGVLKCS